MRMRSFQLKLALASLVFSGLSLVAFGLMALVLFQRMSLRRIDLELRSWSQMQLSQPRDYREWQRFEQDMAIIFSNGSKPITVVLLVQNPQRETIYHSLGALSEAAGRSLHQLLDAGDAGPARLPAAQVQPRSPARTNTRHFAIPASCVTVRDGRRSYRVVILANERISMAFGIDLDGMHADLSRVGRSFLLALPIPLLLAAAGGWLLSRRALRPVRRVTETASRIHAQGLHRRIPLESEDAEFAELVTVFNGMLDRLEASFGQAIRFSADAAHELKTPLTILQGEIEAAQRNTSLDSDQQSLLSSLMREVQRLKAIIHKLLLLSKADAGQLRPTLQPTDLATLVHETIEDIGLLAPELDLHHEITAPCMACVDADLLRQVLHNLASNAIRYSRKGGQITLLLRIREGAILFTITNQGPPIPEQDQPRIFDRFYRGAADSARTGDGTGLGLSLAREIVNVHGGQLVLDHSDGEQTSFTMHLPVAELLATGPGHAG